MPITPFMGVRISWLMLARNSLLARLAASAFSLASRSWTLDLTSSSVRAATVCSNWSRCRSSASSRLLDFRQHFIEGVGELPQVVVGLLHRARPIVLARDTRRATDARCAIGSRMERCRREERKTATSDAPAITARTTHRKCWSWRVSSPKSDSSATVPIFCPPLRMLLNTVKRWESNRLPSARRGGAAVSSQPGSRW